MRSSHVDAHAYLADRKSAGKTMRCLFSGIGGTADLLLVAKGVTFDGTCITLEGLDNSFATIVLSGRTPPDAIDIGMPTNVGDADIGPVSPFLSCARLALRSRGLTALQIWVESGCFLICENDDLIAATAPIQ